MKRWLTHCAIAGYLLALCWGIAGHCFKYCDACHPAMYFVVWDMFCGWSTWEQRLHIVAEGESGNYYRLAPGPWGDYQPYSDIGRHHYDNFGNHTQRIATNCLKHTDHEPIRRVYVIEEAWNKKFNQPESLQQDVVPVGDTQHSYFYLRDEFRADGSTVVRRTPWFQLQANRTVIENPRLRLQANKAATQFVRN